MLYTCNLGDSLTTATGAKSAFGVGDLEDVYVTIGGAFGTATATVQTSSDGGTTWDTYDSTTATEKLVGPLPPCTLVRGNTTSHGATGTVSYRLAGNRVISPKMMVGETVCGKGEDIKTSVDTTSALYVGGCGPSKVWLSSADWVGTAVVKVSFDGGSTWGIVATVTTASGATASVTTCPRATHVKVVATTNTSGTLKVRYGANKEAQI